MDFYKMVQLKHLYKMINMVPLLLPLLGHVLAKPSSTSACQFPFIYKDVRYTQCTTKDDKEEKLWCSTKTDNQDNHIGQMGYWKYCTETQNIEQNQGRLSNVGGSCDDNNPSCSEWATMGECQKNPAYMLSNCRSSCNNCHPLTPVPGKCAEGILEGDTWEENGCRQECKGGQIYTSEDRCGPIILADCLPGAKWTEKVNDVILNCICRNGVKQCQPRRPQRCVEGNVWKQEFGNDCTSTTYCDGGQWGRTIELCPNRALNSPRLLAPLIPFHLNNCKVLEADKLQHAEFNESCKKCEHCKNPCHVFNVLTCRCHCRPYKCKQLGRTC